MERLQVSSVCVIVKHLFNKQETKGESCSTPPGLGAIHQHASWTLCVCVFVCVYFLMMAMGLCVPQKWLGECFQLSDMSWRSEVKRHSLTPTHTLSAAQHSLTRVCCHQESSLIKSSSLSNTHTHTHTLTACRLSPYPRVSWGDHVCISVCICVCVCVCVCIIVLLCDNFFSSVKELSPAVKGQRGDLSPSTLLCVTKVCVCVYLQIMRRREHFTLIDHNRENCVCKYKKKTKQQQQKKQVCKWWRKWII